MELLELKSVWNAVVEVTLSDERVDGSAVERSIKKDSRSVLAKIKRVMYFKFFFGGLTLVTCLVVFIGSFINPAKFAFHEAIFDLADNRMFLATGIIFISAMLSWNFKAFQEIKRFETTARSVKKSLEKFVAIMAKTIRLNIYSGTAFNAMVFGWICYLINTKLDVVTGTIPIIFMAIGVIALSGLIFYVLARYEQKVKFGNYVDQLKSNLNDLQEK